MSGIMTHRLGVFNPAAGGATYVRSIQQVAITIATGATTNTATLSPSVTTANTLILWQGQTTNNTGSSSAEILTSLTLTNSTTVTATRNTSSASFTTTVYAVVVEFKAAAVVGVQYGSIGLSSAQTSNTATISSVNTANSAVFYLGLISNNTTSTSQATQGVALDLTNSTTVTATRSSSLATTLVVPFAVVEFQSGIAAIQQRSITLTTSNTSDTDTISSVDITRTILAPNGATSVNASFSNAWHRLSLTAATSVIVRRLGTSANSRTIKYTVIEFASGVLSTVKQPNVITLGSGTSTLGSTITAVGSAAVCSSIGEATNATTYNNALAAASLTSTTNVQAVRGGTTNQIDYNYQVVEFS